MNNREELVSYFREEIKHIGFVLDGKDNIRSRYYFGKIFPFSFHDQYTIDIVKIDFVKNIYIIKMVHSYPIYSSSENHSEVVVNKKKMIMNASSTIKEIVIGNVTMYSTFELDTENISELLRYIINIDVIKNHLRKRKLNNIKSKIYEMEN